MIRNQTKFETWLPALFDGQFHWDFLKPAFNGTKIEPMDFDAVVERYGKKLIFETKSQGKKIELGQAITLTNEWKDPKCTIIHLEGKTPKNITGYALYKDYEKGKKIGDYSIIKADSFDVLYITRCWYCYASNQNIPTREQWDNQLWQWDYERNINIVGEKSEMV